MVKFKMLMVALVLVAFGTTAVFADSPRDRDRRDNDRREKQVRIAKVEKREARKVLKRTTSVMVAAQKTVKRHKVYTGDLARAYQHQKFAKTLFANGEYERSVRQSLRARQLAYMAMQANKTRYKEDYDRDERNYRQDMKNDDLDRDAYDRMKDQPRKDDDIIRLNVQAEFGF